MGQIFEHIISLKMHYIKSMSFQKHSVGHDSKKDNKFGN